MSRLVVDTSALLSLLLAEDDAEAIADAIDDHEVLISAATLVETEIVIERKQGLEGTVALQELLYQNLQVTVVDFTATHASAAVGAYRRFGKGVHPAGLNLGDCFSYALASSIGAPLLFKGIDFSRTDMEVASISRDDS